MSARQNRSTKKNNLLTNNNQLIYAFDSQQLSAWQMCQQKFDLSYVKHLEYRTQPPGIRKGAVMHRCYESFYLTEIAGGTYQECVQTATQALLDAATSTGMPQEELTLCLIKATSYFEAHREPIYKPIKVETGFSHPIYESPQIKILYEGRIDLLVRLNYNNQLAWVDHKNYLIKEKPSFNTNQFYGYTWIMYKLFSGEYSGQGMQDCTWMAESNKGPAAHDMFMQSFTYDQVVEWEKQTITSLLEMAAYMNSRNWRFAQPPQKNIFSCTAGKYGGCKFMGVCHAGNQESQEYQQIIKLKPKQEKWSAW